MSQPVAVVPLFAPVSNSVERIGLHLREKYVSRQLLADEETVVEAWHYCSSYNAYAYKI